MSVAECSKGHVRNRSSTFRFDSRASYITYPSATAPACDVDEKKFQSFKYPTLSSSVHSPIYHDKAGLFSLPSPPLTPSTSTPIIDIESYPGFEISDELESRHSDEMQVIDLHSMDTFDSEISPSLDPEDSVTWSPYKWPTECSATASREFGLKISPRGGQYTERASGTGSYFTYRFKRGLLLRRVPSAVLIQAVLLGSWVAMGVLIILAVGLIIRIR